MTELSGFAVSPPGFEDLVAGELNGLGVAGVRRVPGGVEFQGGWSAVYRANLSSRVATRILVRLGAFPAHSFRRFRSELERIEWRRWLPAGCGVDLRVTARRSRLYHTGRLQQEAAEVLGAQCGAHPAPAGEGFRVQIRLERDRAAVSLDTSGEALYRRGYRTHVGAAPLRENLAAALLLRAGWSAEEALLDPFCGSGVFPVEAARMALAIPPGRDRTFAFQGLPGFDPELWERVRGEAALLESGRVRPSIFGSDRDPQALRWTARAARLAGVADEVHIAQVDVGALEAPVSTGLVIANPPYGRRLGRADSAYRRLGELLRGPLGDWRWAVILPDGQAHRALGLKAAVSHSFRSGGLPLRFMVGQGARP